MFCSTKVIMVFKILLLFTRFLIFRNIPVVGESCDPDKDICPLNSDCFENECTCLNETIALPDSSICVEIGLGNNDLFLLFSI